MPGLRPIHAVDVDLDRIGIRQVAGSLRSKPATAMLRGAASSRRRFDGLIGRCFRRILHLDLKHQVAAALEIETEMDIVGRRSP